MTTDAYRIDLMLMEIHKHTHTHDTPLIDTNRYHCSLHNTTSLRHEQLQTVGGNRDHGYLALHLWRGPSDVWLQ
jgi:hypothetical protein